jgi:hypothetical protein
MIVIDDVAFCVDANREPIAGRMKINIANINISVIPSQIFDIQINI